MSDKTRVAYKVVCPADGPLLIKHSGLHVILRNGQDQHVLTYFCPTCGLQRYERISKGSARVLIDDLKVAWSAMQIPKEALEDHHGAPITETEVRAAIKSMDRMDWNPGLT